MRNCDGAQVAAVEVSVCGRDWRPLLTTAELEELERILWLQQGERSRPKRMQTKGVMTALQSAATHASVDEDGRRSEAAGDKGGGGRIKRQRGRQPPGNMFSMKQRRSCLPALHQAVDGGHHFIALQLRLAPQNSNIFLDTRVRNFNAEQLVPLSRARGASNLGPSHAAALPALASALRHIATLQTLSADADEPH